MIHDDSVDIPCCRPPHNLSYVAAKSEKNHLAGKTRAFWGTAATYRSKLAEEFQGLNCFTIFATHLVEWIPYSNFKHPQICRVTHVDA